MLPAQPGKYIKGKSEQGEIVTKGGPKSHETVSSLPSDPVLCEQKPSINILVK